MKNMSVKTKITIWYTLFMTLLILFVMWLLFTAGSRQITFETKQRLQNAVHKSFGEIEYENGMLDFDDDIEDFAQEAYLSFYDMQGTMLYGRNPSGFSGATDFIMDETRQIRIDGAIWYVYDYRQTLEGYGSLWGRGIISQARAAAALRSMVRLALIFLPFFILCIALGGCYIIKKALAPLAAMTQTALLISNGSDLSKRIRLGPGEDEVHRLAHTFDHMMDKLEVSFENEKQFTSDVSHELRTPVTVILAQCEYAAQEDAAPEELRSSIHVIQGQARKMSKLISQLLTLARTDSGRQKLHLELLNLSELADIITEEQKSYALSRQITLDSDIQPDLYLCADETMMMRLFMNLITNSITYGRENGRTQIILTGTRTEITGRIIDNGIGIFPDEINHIWKRFYQADPSRSSDQNGSGLGLPMVKWIVEAHGGTITVTSTPGEGSCFTFTFPVKDML